MRTRFLFALLFIASILAAQEQPERPAYVFLSYVNLGDAEQRINDYGADGFRMVGFQRSMSGALVAAMQDVAPFGEARYEYKLLSGHFQRYMNDKQPLPPLLTELGGQGWRVVRGSLLNMNPEMWNSDTNDYAFVAERVLGDNTPVEYRLDRAMMASNAINDLQRDMHDGFTLLMTYSYRGERASLLERSADMEKPFDPGAPKRSKSSAMLAGSLWPASTSVSGQGLEVLNFTPSHKREKLEDATRRGMHLLALSSAPDAYFSTIFAAEPSLPPPVYVYGEVKLHRNRESTPMFKFPSEQWATVEQQINAVAAKGYAISVRPIFLSRPNFAMSQITLHYIIPMEANGAKRQYKIVLGDKLPEVSDAVNQAAADGWSIVPGLLYGDRIVFLEKREPEAER